MGFFKDMGLIGKVRKNIRAIESIINTNDSTILRQGNAYQIRELLNELIEISNRGNRTIDYADFEFIGRKNKLAEIIYIIDSFLRMHGY